MKSIVSFIGMAAVIVAFAGLDTVSARDTARGRDRVIQHSYRTQARRPAGAETMGAGPSVPANGPFYDNSIHQSVGGRDSRGFPKYCPNGRC